MSLWPPAASKALWIATLCNLASVKSRVGLQLYNMLMMNPKDSSAPRGRLDITPNRGYPDPGIGLENAGGFKMLPQPAYPS